MLAIVSASRNASVPHKLLFDYMVAVRPKSKQINTTNLTISFSMENAKRAAQVGFKPTTYCL